MGAEIIRLACLAVIFLLQMSSLANANIEAGVCKAPNGSPGHCLLFTECANLTQWRIQHNLNTVEDVKAMNCNQSDVYVCCNHTNPYFTDTDYLSHLNTKGVDLLKENRCAGPVNYRLSGGEVAALGEYPFMALLSYEGSKRKFLCGGSLITPWFVLTAAHCMTPSLVGVRLGEQDLSTDVDCSGGNVCMPSPEDFSIAQKFQHPRFSRRYLTHDVALLKLDREVKFNMHIKPICLPITPLVYDHKNLPQRYVIAGWGHTENTTNTEVLQHAKIPHRSRDACQKLFGPVGITITNDHICAGGEGRVDSCKGDSGGPLFAAVPFMEEAGIFYYRHVQYGIVSFGLIGCGGQNTNVAAYANVFEYMPWITEILATNTPT